MDALLHIDGDPAPSIDKTGGRGMMPFFTGSGCRMFLRPDISRPAYQHNGYLGVVANYSQRR